MRKVYRTRDRIATALGVPLEEFKKRAGSQLHSLFSVTGRGDFNLLPDHLYEEAMRIAGWPDPVTGEFTLAPKAWVQRKIMQLNFEICNRWERLARAGVPVLPQNRETDFTAQGRASRRA